MRGSKGQRRSGMVTWLQPFGPVGGRKRARDRGRNRAPPELQLLEDRRLLSNDPTVSLPGDGMSGGMPDPGTLRWAIDQVNGSGGGTITFSVASVTPTSDLPTITAPVTIQGPVTINSYGLTLYGGNSTVENVTIQGAADDGLFVSGSGNLVTGNQIEDSVAWGVIISDGPSNTVGGTGGGAGNTISGNQEGGLALIGGGSTGDLVQGNFIGTDPSGTSADGNAYSGVYVGSGDLFTNGPAGSASGATIGGTTSAAANVISGNDYADTSNGGIVIYGAGASDNLIEGNLIGVTVSGDSALANIGIGVDIFYGATDNTVGGTTSDYANVISANTGAGVVISGTGTTGNVVEGNFIGTDSAGDTGLGNADDGVQVYGGASDNTIGGSTSGAGNTISGQWRRGG